MILSIFKFFERIGRARAANKLRFMGYHDIADNLK